MNNMNNKKLPVLAIVLAATLLASVRSYAQIPQDVLKSVPYICLYVAVVNVKSMIESPIYYAKAQNRQRLIGEISEDLDTIVKLTGLDPIRDISYLTVSDKLIIANGRLDQQKIRRYIKSQKVVDEMKPGDPLVVSGGSFLITSSSSMLGISIDEAIKTKIAFLSEKEIVIGKAVDVAIALRTAQKKFKSIIENRTMESLINVVPTDAMIWFAGLDQTVLDKAPVPVPAGASNRSIRGITGSFTLTNAVSGNVVIHTTDSVSAGAINKLYSKLGTVTRLIEGPAGLKWLAEGLSAKLDGTQINLSLNYPVDTLENLRNWSDFPVSEAEVGIKFTDKALAENDMVAPVELLKRRPPAYPEKARSAGISGSVILRCIIRPDGIPDKIEILNGLGYGLDESAVNTVLSKYRFIPAILNGKPVSMAAEIKIDFRPF